MQPAGIHSRYLRVCGPDLDEVLATYDGWWTLVDDDTLALGDRVCSAHGDEGAPPPARADVFVYVWRRGDERAEYYGVICDDHARDLINHFGLVRDEQASTSKR
jgi:hypothetical protein